MNHRIEGGLLLAAGVVLGSGLVVQVQSCAHEPAPRETREERRVERAAPEPTTPPVVTRAQAEPAAPTPGPVPLASAPAPASPSAPRPAVAEQARTLTTAGGRVNRVPASALARLRRWQSGLSGAVAFELAKGTRALERGKPYTAYAHFLQASKFAPRNADALMGIALCHFELDHRRAARRMLTRVFALDATHPEAAILTGFMEQLSRDPTRAAEWYQRALDRVDDEQVASELRAVIAQLQPASPTTLVTRTTPVHPEVEKP